MPPSQQFSLGSLDLLNGPKTPAETFNVAEPTPQPSSTVVPIQEVSQPVAPAPTFEAPNRLTGVQSQIDSIKAGLNQANEMATRIQSNNSTGEADPRATYQQNILDLMGRDDSQARQDIREDEGLADAELRARNALNRITERDNYYRDEIERVEVNEDGKLAGALNADIRKLEQQRSREMADLSFTYQVARGDFDAAEAAVNARIQDMEDDRQNDIAVFERALEFAQDDLSESEKLAAQQNFQVMMDERNFEQQKELATFEDNLRRERELVTFNREQQVINTAETLNTIQDAGVAGTSDDPILAMLAGTAAFKDLTGSQAEPLTQSIRVLDGLTDLQTSIAGANTDPILGLFKKMNPYDLQAATIDAAITQLVPQLARGTYGEVGVLTDSDMARYAATLPNLTSTTDQNKAVMALTLRKVRSGFVSQLESMAAAGRNVSRYATLYSRFDSEINRLEADLGIGATDDATLDGEFDEFSNASGSTDDQGGFWRGVGRFFFGN